MKRILFPLLLCLVVLRVSTGFSAETALPTEEEIAKAQATRDAGIKAGADKISREEILALTRQNIPEELSGSERKAVEKAVLCTHHKIAELTYRGPIEHFARFLADETYQQEVKQQIDKECHMVELYDILGKPGQ